MQAMSEGKAIVEKYVEAVATLPVTAMTIWVEKQLRADLGPFVLLGRLDRVDEHEDGTVEVVDYKDISRLRLAIDERGKILPRRKTHCSAHIQRQLTVAIKRARHLALLPFVPVDRRR